MVADEDPTTDEILAAFRTRRQAAVAPPAVPGDELFLPAKPPEADREPSEPAGGSSEAPPVADEPAVADTPDAGEAVARPAAQPFAPPLGSRSPGALAIRPAVQSPGPVALTAGAPGLNLSSRLLEDRFVARSGSRAGVTVGLAVALAGLAAVVLDQALRSRGGPLALPGQGLSLVGLAAAGLGLLAAIAFLFLPRRRSIRVRLAATQQEEWARVKAEAARLRSWSLAGAAMAVAGLSASAAAYAFVAQPAGGYLAGAFAAVALLGAALLAWAAARRGVVQRLYVQTLVLSRLEQTGLGPAAEPDPRVAPVLRSLDRLLGALPESAVRRFLASDEAAQYLELIDDLSKDRGHGR